jgi:hypothetical protein
LLITNKKQIVNFKQCPHSERVSSLLLFQLHKNKTNFVLSYVSQKNEFRWNEIHRMISFLKNDISVIQTLRISFQSQIKKLITTYRSVCICLFLRNVVGITCTNVVVFLPIFTCFLILLLFSCIITVVSRVWRRVKVWVSVGRRVLFCESVDIRSKIVLSSLFRIS